MDDKEERLAEVALIVAAEMLADAGMDDPNAYDRLCDRVEQLREIRRASTRPETVSMADHERAMDMLKAVWESRVAMLDLDVAEAGPKALEAAAAVAPADYLTAPGEWLRALAKDARRKAKF